MKTDRGAEHSKPSAAPHHFKVKNTDPTFLSDGSLHETSIEKSGGLSVFFFLQRSDAKKRTPGRSGSDYSMPPAKEDSHMKRSIYLLSALICLATASCSDTTGPPDDEYQYFEFEATGGERFFAETSDPDVIRSARNQLSLPESERTLFINGEIARGTGRNQGWSWHFVPDEWRLVEIAAEVCDGRPSFVEEDLDYWVENVGRFCPWNSMVVREVER